MVSKCSVKQAQESEKMTEPKKLMNEKSYLLIISNNF